jgi:hypothetical protein
MSASCWVILIPRSSHGLRLFGSDRQRSRGRRDAVHRDGRRRGADGSRSRRPVTRGRGGRLAVCAPTVGRDDRLVRLEARRGSVHVPQRDGTHASKPNAPPVVFFTQQPSTVDRGWGGDGGDRGGGTVRASRVCRSAGSETACRSLTNERVSAGRETGTLTIDERRDRRCGRVSARGNAGNDNRAVGDRRGGGPRHAAGADRRERRRRARFPRHDPVPPVLRRVALNERLHHADRVRRPRARALRRGRARSADARTTSDHAGNANAYDTVVPRRSRAMRRTGGRRSELILAHYMPWYETPGFRGYWGNHWTGFNNEANPNQIGPDGQRDIWSNYYPIIGPYDSADPDTLECHLLQMKLAGIDGVIPDWYGISSAADYPIIQVATEALYDAAAQFGMEFAACFEDRTVEYLVNTGQLPPRASPGTSSRPSTGCRRTGSGRRSTPASTGGPCCSTSGRSSSTRRPLGTTRSALLPDRPLFFPLHQLWQSVNADGGFNWVHFNAFDGHPSEATIRATAHEHLQHTSVQPGAGHPLGGPGLRRCLRGRPLPLPRPQRGRDLPRHARCRHGRALGDRPARHLERLRRGHDHRAHRGVRLHVPRDRPAGAPRRAGGDFAFSADDLRLPAFLYELRKRAAHPPATLDAVRDALNAGDTDQARGLLEGVASGALGAVPSSTIVDAGGTITIGAQVSSVPFDYELRWERDGFALADGGRFAGTTSPTLVISDATRFDSGEYRLRVRSPARARHRRRCTRVCAPPRSGSRISRGTGISMSSTSSRSCRRSPRRCPEHRRRSALRESTRE